MQIHNLSETPSILNTFMSEIRDVSIQNDRMRFRRNIERIGEVLGYELSKSLSFEKHQTETPLGNHNTTLYKNDIVYIYVFKIFST